MAKNILIKLRNLTIVLIAFAFVLLLGIKVIALLAGVSFEVTSIIYWLLFLLLVLIATYNFSNKLLLPFGILFYALGSLMFVFTFRVVSEVLLRVSILFFLVGVVRAIFNNKRGKLK